jgi:hypothetical protein
VKYKLLGTVASSLVIILLGLIAAPVHATAGIPSEPHNADAIWVEPSTVSLSASDIGKDFNVTVSMNLTETIFAYQFALYYNRTVLKGVEAGFTNGSTSYYFRGHATSSEGPLIDTGSTGPGSVLAYETLLDGDNSTGHAGTLAWIEFQVLSNVTVPAGGNVTCIFNIAKDNYNGGNTWWTLDGITYYTFTNTYNSQVVVMPEFPDLLILPIFLGLTLVVAIFSKRLPRRNLKYDS